ncbi:MAG: hypothetical protein D3918_07510 [Candidatus Electrothrix sp. AX2]|nr:hypothetical protein [Candidatus Electrothrix gigas]
MPRLLVPLLLFSGLYVITTVFVVGKAGVGAVQYPELKLWAMFASSLWDGFPCPGGTADNSPVMYRRGRVLVVFDRGAGGSDEGQQV